MSRPNFFKTFACEDGRPAFQPTFGNRYLTEAFLQALSTLGPGSLLDELLTTMDQNVRNSCGGLQKICVYSTSYRLAKQIIFWDEQADVVEVGPTLLTMRKDHLLSLKPSEMQLFHRHRQTSDPKERKQIFLLPTLSDDLRAMLLLRSLADKKSTRGTRRFLSTADFATAIRRRGLKPGNVKLVLCVLNLMQAKFLCDKGLAVLGQAIMGKSRTCNDCMASVDRKMERVDRLLTRAICVLDQHTTHPYLRGRVEEVIAESVAVRVFKQMLSYRSSWPSLADIQQQVNECSGHFQRSLHAYSEGSFFADSARLGVIWRLSAVFAALFSRDILRLLDHLEHFNHALAACKVYHPNYEKQWVIKRALAVANLGIQTVHPAITLIRKVSP